MIDAHRTHILAGRRSVTREYPSRLTGNFADRGQPDRSRISSPEAQIRRAEQFASLQDTLNLLRSGDRQIVLIRQFENWTPARIAEHFGITERATKVRTVRALFRLREILTDR